LWDQAIFATMSEAAMNLRFQVVRLLSWLLCFLSLPAALLGVAAALASFRMPEIELTELYRWSTVGIRVGMGAIFTAVVVGWGHSWLAEPFTGVTKAGNEALRRLGWSRNGWPQSLAVVMLLVLVFSSLILGVRYVHPKGNLWISTGKTGPWEVSAAVARLYLWRGIRMDAAFLLGAALILGPISWAALVGIRQVETSGEELVPKVVVHVRPRDFR
jgi:hypothetical protein